MFKETLRLERVVELPDHADEGTIYVLLPKNFSQEKYMARLERELGIEDKTEQDYIYNATVLIAGCGGMGGTIAVTCLRRGYGTILIADPETFTASNHNRQEASGIATEGKSKSIETARRMRSIADDTTIVVLPTGYTDEAIELLGEYAENISLIYDEIELFAFEPRIALHLWADKMNVPIINCNTIIYSTFLFLFEGKNGGMTLWDCFGISKNELQALHLKLLTSSATPEECAFVREKMLKILIPYVPEYSLNTNEFSTKRNWAEAIDKNIALVTATNPPGASSFAASQGVFLILRENSPIKRLFPAPPKMGYFRIDFGMITAEIVNDAWFLD